MVDTTPQAVITRSDNVTHVTLVAPQISTLQSGSITRVTADALLEREQALIDALLLRFRNIVELAAQPEGEITKEVAAAQAFQMRVETAALVLYTPLFMVSIVTDDTIQITAGEDLLKLTRELKELWLMGPLRGLGEGEAEANAKMDEDAKKVEEMVRNLVKQANGLNQGMTVN